MPNYYIMQRSVLARIDTRLRCATRGRPRREPVWYSRPTNITRTNTIVQTYALQYCKCIYKHRQRPLTYLLTSLRRAGLAAILFWEKYCMQLQFGITLHVLVHLVTENSSFSETRYATSALSGSQDLLDSVTV